MPLITCNQKEFFDCMKIKWFLEVLLLHLDLEISIGEVKWAFFQKPLDNFLWKFGNSILMPMTVCIQKEFWIESKLKVFWGEVLLLHLDLEILYRGERRWSKVLYTGYYVLIFRLF